MRVRSSLTYFIKSDVAVYFAVFIPGIFLGGGGGIPRKNLHPPKKAPNCVLFFFGRDSELQICHGSFLLIDNKHRKLFTIKQSNGCKFMSKMHRNTFVVRVPFMRSPRHPSHNKGAYFYGERGEGLKGRGRGVLIIIF